MVKKAKKRSAKKGVSRKKVIRKKKPEKKRQKKRRVRKTARKSVKKGREVRPRTPELPAEPIGRVTHYFSKAKAAAILIERDEIRLGDVLYFKGHTTNFKQKVESLQIDRQPVSRAEPGQEAGLRVRSRTREHDSVFKL